MDATPNWIDSLWANPHDREAEEHLRQLWLGFQADRKDAWEKLRTLAETSQKLLSIAQSEVEAVCWNLPSERRQNLAFEAVNKEAVKMLYELRWKIPASTRGVFVPYLRSKHAACHDWVQRAIAGNRARRGISLDESRTPYTGEGVQED